MYRSCTSRTVWIPCSDCKDPFSSSYTTGNSNAVTPSSGSDSGSGFGADTADKDRSDSGIDDGTGSRNKRSAQNEDETSWKSWNSLDMD